MKTNSQRLTACGIFVLLCSMLYAQTCEWVSTTENEPWKQSTVKLKKSADVTPLLEVNGNEDIVTFKAWGTCFNELGWDALNVLSRDEQEEIMKNVFSPNGDLRFTMGRIPMNASDYARSWYSCDEVSGDFNLKYFNIDRDKQTIIPFIRSAQKYNPNLTFWISPWSPPSWMKINHDYPVRSSQYNAMSPKLDYLLFEDNTEKQSGVFPRQLAVNDYFIQEPRYLQAYANYFCRFIESYQEQGVPIDKVMYQNEAYSYTPYPGCAWTAEGTVRFNVEYLAPTLKKRYPEVELYLGTINTNRLDYIERILSAPGMVDCIKGVGFQWEGAQILPKIRAKYPQLKYISSESECGDGNFDWRAGEHTFNLMNHYLGNGCDEYTFWNFILCDNGQSAWGWKQNALIQVNSSTRKARYTAEYFAVKHYSHYVAPGSRILKYREAGGYKMPVMIVLTPENKMVVIAGNFNDEAQTMCVKIGERFLNVTLQPHSFNTFKVK